MLNNFPIQFKFIFSFEKCYYSSKIVVHKERIIQSIKKQSKLFICIDGSFKCGTDRQSNTNTPNVETLY